MKIASILCVAALAVVTSFAEDAAPAKEQKPAAAPEMEKTEAPLFWGFGNYGVYSGYQLYGSLVNPEPTTQGYLEGNMNLNFLDEWDLGYLGVGIWSNTDLTDRRRGTGPNNTGLGKAFNEWDFNVHWGRTFWFDDEKKYGIDYRTSVVWYYYPHRRHDHSWGSTSTTMDWNHYFELVNPYVNPFINVVHEYHESDGNLLEFGLKRNCKVTDKFTTTPALTFVWRNSNYGWCFPHYGLDSNYQKINSCLATMKVGLDSTYQLTDHFGLFAKVAYCSIIDDDLRDAADYASGQDYGKYKDFVWGGVGLTVNF